MKRHSPYNTVPARRLFCCISLLLSLIFSPASAPASEKVPFLIPKVESEVQVDAVLDEKLWEEALVLEIGFEVTPGENVPPPARTEVLLACSDTHLFAAFKAYDPAPDMIRAHLTDRDNIFYDDWVSLVLDTFNDERRAYDFCCNPLGVQWDFVEGAHYGGIGEWDGIWDSDGRICDWGYVVEMKVPFSTLSFQRSEGEQIWGLDLVRSMPRSVRHHIGLFPRDRDNSCYLCQTEKIAGFAGATPGRNLEFDPTLSALLTQEREGDTGGPFVTKTEKLDPGLTGRWGFTPNMTLSGTVNPDFSQVEADAAQLDINTDFTLFYPEKRPFFLEGADFFTTYQQTVHTRSFADPAWGLKLTGKEGPNTVGIFTVRDEITNLILPGSQSSGSGSLDKRNYGTVARFRRDVGPSSILGALFTDREGEGYHNRLAGIDGDLRLTPSERIRFQLLGSNTLYPEDLIGLDEDGDGDPDHDLPAEEINGTALEFNYSHDARDLDWYAELRQISPNYRADLGFVPQVGIRRVEAGGDHTWWGESGKWYSKIELHANWDRTEEEDGSLIEHELETALTYEGPLQSVVQMVVGGRERFYNERQFVQNFQYVFFQMRPSSELYLELFVEHGDHIDFEHTRPAKRLRLEPTVEFRPGRRLTFSLDHFYELLDVADGRLYTANLSQLRTVYQLNRRTFLRVILQYLDVKRDTALYTDEIDRRERHLFTQLLLSYKINPQTVFFLGYSDNHNGDQDMSLTQADRTFFVKIGYAWVL